MRKLLAGFLAIAGCSYSAPNVCEIDTATFELISRAIRTADDARVPFEERIVAARDALLKQPGNVFLHHAFQINYLTWIGAVLRPNAEAIYRKLLMEHPEI